MMLLAEGLRTNVYPGRVVIIARTRDGGLRGVYAVTGRSEASRKRLLRLTTPAVLSVVPVGRHEDDPLRHYDAAVTGGPWTVFGNGRQVSEVITRLTAGVPPALALDDISYEPDAPTFTSRVTAVVQRASGDAWLGASRRSAGRRKTPDVSVLTVRDLHPGDAVLLPTYCSDGERVRTARVHLDVETKASDTAGLLDEVWFGLDERVRVAASAFDPLTGVVGIIRNAQQVD